MTELNPLVTLHNIEKHYTVHGRPQKILGPISFNISAGETLALIGPSGCGKSTLLNLIGEIIALDAGEIHRHVDVHMGYLQQQDALLPWLSAIDNAALPLRLQHVKQSQARQRAANIFEQLKLDNIENHWPSQLSGGMRQRVALARALIDQPQLLLLDEPFRSLDGITRRISHDWFLKIQKRMHFATLLVTHDPEEALTLADRILILTIRPAHIAATLVLPPILGDAEARYRAAYHLHEKLTTLLSSENS